MPPTRKKKTSMYPHRRALMVELYTLGYTSYEIAHALECDASVVRAHVRAAGTQTRRTGPRLRPDVDTEQIMHLVDDLGLSYSATARLVGLSRTATRLRYLRRHFGYGWRYSPPQIQGTAPGGHGARRHGRRSASP